MKKIFLISVAIIGTLPSQASNNPEYQKMLAVRNNILGLQKSQESSQSLAMLIKEEKTLTSEFANLSVQVKRLKTSK